jgi:hypothetical protein
MTWAKSGDRPPTEYGSMDHAVRAAANSLDRRADVSLGRGQLRWLLGLIRKHREETGTHAWTMCEARLLAALRELEGDDA